MLFKHFTERLTEINNFLNLFPGLDTTKKVTPEELNEILLHTVTNGWAKQDYLQGCDFEMKTFRETCTMFKQIEIAEQVYKGQKTSKKIPMPYANRDSSVRKRKGGEAALPNSSKKGCADKRKTKNTVSPSEKTIGADKTCFLHGPVNFSEECKVPK